MIYSFIKKLRAFLLLFAISLQTAAQYPLQKINLNDLSAFQPQAGNWQIIGDIIVNRNCEIHPAKSATIDDTNKKSTILPPYTIVTGNGVLANITTETQKSNLLTNWQHGDIDIELEVLVPKNTNSGIYLQGRYEVQLFDSWGIKNPCFSDIGGIYKNHEAEPAKMYAGKAPLSNPSKAPGLWQQLKISFQAPRFNNKGIKISNARFISIELNGIKIHENIEVPHPTGGAIGPEAPTGPLMIQGDYGMVAFRNIRYRMFDTAKIVLNNHLSYDYYEGVFKSISDLKKIKKSGKTENINFGMLEKNDNIAVKLKGDLLIPVAATYKFTMAVGGGVRLSINNKPIAATPGNVGWWEPAIGTVHLTAGTHNFEIIYFKSLDWTNPTMGITVESEHLRTQTLHAIGTQLNDGTDISPVYVNATNEPRLLRAFVDFKGNKKLRRTHTIGVGDPIGTHYVYDLKAGNVLCVWRGDFVDATPMWHDRGDGSFKPRGSTQFLYIEQTLGVLKNLSDDFPNEYKEEDFKGKGYDIDVTTGRPIFKYIYKNMEVEEKVFPSDAGKAITRAIILKNKPANLYCKLAEGSSILLLSDGSYIIDDKLFYISDIKGGKPQIRDSNEKKELILPIAGDSNSIQYSIIW